MLDYVGGLVPFRLLRYKLFKLPIDAGIFLIPCFMSILVVILWFQVTRSTNLLLHINGTYRANWAERLGFCKGPIH